MEQKVISSDLIRGHIDTIILHTLLNSDKYAQQISDCINEKSGNLYQINQATLYSSLKRLEGLKHLKSYWNDSETGRRKYFNLTDTGRQLVEDNLSSWSYSRYIIDKLMDCVPEPVIIERVEKVVEVRTNNSNNLHNSNISPVIDLSENKKSDCNLVAQNEIKITDKSPEKESETEINFRNILNGLIKTSIVKHQNEDIETVTVESVENKQDIQKFHEKIDAKNFIHKEYSVGKVDLSDLILKATKEGYKLKISSKDSYVNHGTLLINKLNLFTTSAMFILSLIIFFLLKTVVKNYVLIETVPTLLVVLGLVVSPLFMAIKYSLKPNKTTSKTFGVDTVLISLIVVFNLTLITFAGNLLFNVDFSDLKSIILSLIFPTTLYLMIVIHYLIKFSFSKLKICYQKTTKKTA